MNPESRPYPAGTGGEGPRELHSQLIPHTSYSRSEEVQCGCSLFSDHTGASTDITELDIVPKSITFHHTILLEP